MEKLTVGITPRIERTKMSISKKQIGRLELVLDLADELCVAVDRAAEDIGGSRPIDKILRDLGPAVDDAQDHQRKRPT